MSNVRGFKPVEFFGGHGMITYVVFGQIVLDLPAYEEIVPDILAISMVAEFTKDPEILESVERVLDWLDDECPASWDWYDFLSSVMEESVVY